jgi:hypothetical protein
MLMSKIPSTGIKSIYTSSQAPNQWACCRHPAASAVILSIVFAVILSASKLTASLNRWRGCLIEDPPAKPVLHGDTRFARGSFGFASG